MSVEADQILQMLEERITNDYKVTGCYENMIYLTSRKTGNQFIIRIDEDC